MDGVCWLRSGLSSVGEDAVIRFCMERVAMLQRKGVEPVVVFDSEQHLAVRVGSWQPQRRRGALRRPCVSFARVRALVRELAAADVEHVFAPFQAAAQMAYLSVHGHVDVCISEDTELLAFGCKRLMFSLEIDGRGREILLSEVLGEDPLAQFQAACVLMGCLQLPQLPGLGDLNALRLVAEFGPDPRVLAREMRALGVQVPSTYERSFNDALHVFRFQTVLDTSLRRVPLRELSPPPLQLKYARRSAQGQWPVRTVDSQSPGSPGVRSVCASTPLALSNVPAWSSRSPSCRARRRRPRSESTTRGRPGQREHRRCVSSSPESRVPGLRRCGDGGRQSPKTESLFGSPWTLRVDPLPLEDARPRGVSSPCGSRKGRQQSETPRSLSWRSSNSSPKRAENRRTDQFSPLDRGPSPCQTGRGRRAYGRSPSHRRPMECSGEGEVGTPHPSEMLALEDTPPRPPPRRRRSCGEVVDAPKGMAPVQKSPFVTSEWVPPQLSKKPNMTLDDFLRGVKLALAETTARRNQLERAGGHQQGRTDGLASGSSIVSRIESPVEGTRSVGAVSAAPDLPPSRCQSATGSCASSGLDCDTVSARLRRSTTPDATRSFERKVRQRRDVRDRTWSPRDSAISR